MKDVRSLSTRRGVCYCIMQIWPLFNEMGFQDKRIVVVAGGLDGLALINAALYCRHEEHPTL
jgi:hypothetical protein